MTLLNSLASVLLQYGDMPGGSPTEGIGTGVLVVYLIVLVIVYAGVWKTYQKAGQPGWAAIIPIYNLVVMLQIARKPVWWLILFLIPIVNIIFLIMTYDAYAKSFGKGSGFTVGLILLPFIFWPLLGFGDAEYQSDQPALD